jgi:hypothetical protein
MYMAQFAFKVLRADALDAVTVPNETTAQTEQTESGGWDKVWKVLQSPRAAEPLPPGAPRGGAPLLHINGECVLFRFRAPVGAARNNGGRVRDQRFAMHRRASGLWYKWVEVQPVVHHYKYVSEKRCSFEVMSTSRAVYTLGFEESSRHAVR